MTLSKKEHQKRLKLYHEGYKDREMAEILGITKSAVAQWRWKSKLPSRQELDWQSKLGKAKKIYKRGEAPSKEELEAFYNDLTKTGRGDVEREFGITRRKFYYWLKRYGIPLKRKEPETFSQIMSHHSIGVWQRPNYKEKMSEIRRAQANPEDPKWGSNMMNHHTMYHHEAVEKKLLELRAQGHWAYPIDLPGHSKPDIIVVDKDTGEISAIEFTRTTGRQLKARKKRKSKDFSYFHRVDWLSY